MEQCEIRGCNPEKCTKHYYNEETNCYVRCEHCGLAFIDNTVIPERYRNSVLDDYVPVNDRQKAIKELVVKILEKLDKKEFPKKQILLCAPEFNNKTLLCSIVLKKALEVGFTGRILPFNEATELYFRDRQEFSRYLSVDFLCVQLGNEIPNASTMPIIKEIDITRVSRNKYTMWTMRMPLKDSVYRYGNDFQNYFKDTTRYKEVQLK